MAEREWREASDMRTSAVTTGLVLISAALLRFWALGSGIPYAVGGDEPVIMGIVLDILRSGDFNPHYFDVGGLPIYTQLLVVSVRFMAGAMQGLWSSLDQVGPADFYLWVRGLTAALGTITVLLVYLIGARWGSRHALLAAGLMAVMPFHVRASHYSLPDVAMTLGVTLTFLLSLRANEKASLASFAWAGAVAGLATSVQYAASISLVLPLLAVWMTLEASPSRVRCALAALGAFAVAFVAGSPYTLLDLPAFLNAFGQLALLDGPRTPEMGSGTFLYLSQLRLGLGWPATILALSGLVFGAVRAIKGPGRVRWTLAVVFAVVFFNVIASKREIAEARLLPVLPFACVLASCAVVSGVSLLRRFDIPRMPRTALIVGLTVAALLPPSIAAITFNRNIGKRSTSALAYDWILDRIPGGASVVVEQQGLWLPDDQFRVEHVARLVDRPYAGYASRGVGYLVASSQAFGEAFDSPEWQSADHARYLELFDRSTELARFEPSEDHPGPEIRVYRLR